MKDYYSVLEVAEDATQDDIKKSYRKLAQKHHPDKNNGDGSRFVEIQEAYGILSDLNKKQEYDMQRKGGGLGADLFGNFRSHFSDQQINEDLLRQIHEALYRQAAAQQANQQVIYRVELTLEDAYNGKTMTIDGEQVRFPPGVKNGSRIKQNDKIYQTFIKQHPKFKRTENDLVIDVILSAVEAITGIEVNVDNIDGNKYNVKIPPGTQPAQVFRLAGKGMPILNHQNQRGDLLLRTSLVVPNNLTQEELDAIIKVRKRNSINL